MNREVKKLVRKYEENGWFLDRVGKHYIYKHENGGCVTISKTVSDHRAIKNIEKDFINEERKQNANY